MFPNGVKIFKWPHKIDPSETLVKNEMEQFGYIVYDLQTIPGWFERGLHCHNYNEIRGAVEGNTTFYFNELPLTVEPGDIILIPAGLEHRVASHNSKPFKAFKGSVNGVRSVTDIKR